MGLFFLINEHYSLDLYKGRNKNISDDKSTFAKSTYLRHIVYGHAVRKHPLKLKPHPHLCTDQFYFF